MLRDPENSIAVWKKLGDQFHKKTWANKLGLRRKLNSLRIRGGDSVQQHIKQVTELVEGSVVGDPVSEEDHVVYSVASLL